MVQILPEEVTPTQQIVRGLNTGLSGLLNKFQTQQQQQKSGESLSKVLGKPELASEFSQLPVQLQQVLAKSILDQEQRITLQEEKAKEARIKAEEPFENALDILNRQERLLKTGHIGSKIAFRGTGRKLGSTWSKTGIKARAEYQRLGRSLIGMASTIPVRNRLEFETLAEKLDDPTLPIEELEGTVKAMKRFVSNRLKGRKEIAEEETEEEIGAGVEKTEMKGKNKALILPPGAKSKKEAVWVPLNEVPDAVKKGGKRLRGYVYHG